MSCRDLINSGEPFISNSKHLRDVSINIELAAAIAAKRVTLGEAIAHQLQHSRREHVTATLSTLLADLIPVTAALIGAGLLLAGRQLVAVILSFMSGPLVDRFEARRLLAPCSIVIALGLLAIAAGHVYAGAVVLVFARVLFAIVGPVIAAEQSTDRIGAIAAYATWSDCGLAAGAFLGIVAMQWAGFPLTYVTLAATTLAVLVWFMLRAPSAPPPKRA